MRVAELMTKDVATCRTDDTLSVAAKQMWDADCGALPVLGSDGKVKGMITDRDICMACLMRDAPPSALRVEESMSRALRSCRPDSPVADAEQLMRTSQVRRIPVVDTKGGLAGVLSLADIAREAGRQRGSHGKDIAPEEVISLLESICQPQQHHSQSQRV